MPSIAALRRLICDSSLTESEAIDLGAWIEKFDCARSVGDGMRLADQLISARFNERAVTLFVEIGSVRSARRLSIDSHANARRCSSRCDHTVEVARVKAVGEHSAGFARHRGARCDRPITRKRPMIER